MHFYWVTVCIYKDSSIHSFIINLFNVDNSVLISTQLQHLMETSIDSGHATMATMSTGINSRISSRTRPMKALPLSNLTPVISQEERMMPAEGYGVGRKENGWGHPPSPPVRQRARYISK